MVRTAINVSGGFELDGGHDETKGLTADGRVVEVPLHRHEVSLDFVRFELALELTFADGWDAWLRVPSEIKRQRTTFEPVAPATFDELLAMDRNRFIHHRSDTYEGPGDSMLLVANQRRGLFAAGDVLTVAAGITIPTGRTERDPFERGDAGLKHLHIQFGTGTVDPIAEVYYSLPLTDRIRLSPYVTTRLPLYENAKSFQGPPEVTAGLAASVRLLDWLSAYGEVSLYVQGYAHWDGERDINTGLISSGALLGAALTPLDPLVVNVGVRFPIHQRLLDDSSEAFEQGFTLLASVAWTW